MPVDHEKDFMETAEAIKSPACEHCNRPFQARDCLETDLYLIVCVILLS